MRASLIIGHEAGKALAAAWQIPYVGVHHMQAHLLTPRLASSLKGNSRSELTTPKFPFLSILVSGGHTLFVYSKGLTDHEVMGNTIDIAIGSSLDKAGRDILPDTVLQGKQNITGYGKLLEQFAFPNGSRDYEDYRAPRTREDEISPRPSSWGWALPAPLVTSRDLRLSFSSFLSSVQKILGEKRSPEGVSDRERADLARATMAAVFEHLGSRLVMALEHIKRERRETVETIVISGGVASNRFLMKVLRSYVNIRGFGHVEFVTPPPELCTDNAAMIGWAGIEMYEMGLCTDPNSKALKTWSLDPESDGNGFWDVGVWKKIDS